MTESDEPLREAVEESYRLAEELPAGSAVSDAAPGVNGGHSQAQLSHAAERLKAGREGLSNDEDGAERRFSLSGLFALTTFVGVVLAFGGYVPREIFAGVTGIVTLASMIVLSLFRAPPLAVQIGWWLLLAIYMSAIGWAVLG